jgi:prophage antirepressor-like protein
MDDALVVFQDKDIRRVWFNDEWWFVATDIISVLIDSKDPAGYLKDMRRRDEGFAKGWGQIATPLSVPTSGGKQQMNCVSVKGAFRLIQSISSPKAEPFKIWLAKAGYERIKEIADPELSVNRARENWQKHGRSQKWIQQRMMSQETRNKLTDYWKDHDVTKEEEYAILTNIIHQEWTGLSVKDHKNLKGLKTQNLRDHMSEAELIFTALAELSTRQIAESVNATGMPENKTASKSGGNIAKKARKELEDKTGKNIVTGENFLPEDNGKK